MSYQSSNDDYEVKTVMSNSAMSSAHYTETGHLVLSLQGETLESSGEFTEKSLVESFRSIVADFQLHQKMGLTKDKFKGLTIQYQDAYYKVDLTGDKTTIHRYLMPQANVIT